MFIAFLSEIVNSKASEANLQNSRGRPVDASGFQYRNSTGRPVYEIGNSKTFEANLQNSSGRPVESYWTSSRI